MDFPNLVFIQIALDIVLLLAILILLWRVSRPPASFQKKMAEEMNDVIRESQANADKFLQAMEQSRLALKEIAIELELKEKRAKATLEEARRVAEPINSQDLKRDVGFSPQKYAEVLKMIKKGYSEEETARTTGFTQAEIGLIIDLSRIKNESS